MWLRKHAPRALEQVALSAENRRTLAGYVARRAIPRDLILIGDPGHGKSTVAGILEAALAFHTRLINASGRGGVDVVRRDISELVTVGNAVAQLASRNPGGPYRIIRLEEAQGMTPEALAALRTVMDQRPDWVRFIFTCNRLPGDEAIVDRCHVIEFRDLPLDELVKVVERILAAEGQMADPNTILACAKASPTMRGLIDYVEHSFLERGQLEPPARRADSHRTQKGAKRDVDLLLTVHAIVNDSGRPRLATRDVLARLAEEGRVLTDKDLARALKDFGVRAKTFTDAGAKSARGYLLVDLEGALERSRTPHGSPQVDLRKPARAPRTRADRQ